MLYLLDANVLIDAKNKYYPIKRVPEYWEWLLYKAEKGNIKIPFEIYQELSDPDKKFQEKDDLAQWLETEANKALLLLEEDIDSEALNCVLEEYTWDSKTKAYGEKLSEDELDVIENDAILVSYAHMKENRCVVTLEMPRPSKKRHNKKIPDICNGLNIAWCDPFKLNRELNFSTNWKNGY